MNKTLVIVLMMFSKAVLAAGGAYPNDKAPIDLDDKASLQHGAKLFVNYCMGCHSLQYQRYNRLARDLDLTEELVKDNLIFTAGTKVGDTMQNAMAAADANNWFGVVPPDLTVIARARGVDYLYNYLRGFYLDESRPLGVNNSMFPLVGMPHVLGQLQGWQKPIIETDEHGEETITGFELVEPGSMTPDEFDGAIGDLVNFLAYVGEPIQQERKRVGAWVLLYLLGAAVVFFLLKREYWRDVH